MNPVLVSFNGHNINDTTNYTAKFPVESPLQAVQPGTLFVKRAGAFPIYAGKEFPESSITIMLFLQGTVLTQIEEVNKWFDVYDETPYLLIVKDTANSDKQYYIYATPRLVSPLIGKNQINITLARKDPVWQAVTQTTSGWNITSTGSSMTCTVTANADGYPIFEFTPTGYPAAGGYAFQQYVSMYPNSTVAWPGRPLEVTGVIDHAALVGAAKCQADGDDFRVTVDGVEVDRWFGGGGVNSTTLKMWIVIDMPAKRETALKTAVSDTGTPAYLDIKYSAANKTAITAMPSAGRVMIDSEEFAYTSRTITATVLRLNLGTRAIRGTTAAAHTVADIVRWLPYDISIIYGDATATAQVVDDTRKPVIDLVNSTNASFVYADFIDTGDVIGQRAGSWKPVLQATAGKALTETNYYYGVNDGADTNPAEVMGMEIAVYQAKGVNKAETAILYWRGYFPDATNSVTSNGSKYRVATSWPTKAALQSSILGVKWVQEWNESTPTSAASWYTWTHNAEAVPTGTKYIQFYFQGTVAASAGNAAKFETAGVTVALVNYPTVALYAEVSNFYVEATLTNSTTGEYLTMLYPMQINKTLYIDTDPNQPTAKMDGQLVNVVKPNTNRTRWLRLQPGANVITYDALYNNNITIVVRWKERMNFI